jgi:acetate---CoA ligase (ADP-forming)
MIVKELLKPKSIVIIGASNDLNKPGGTVLKHISEGDFKGDLFVINPKEDEVQGYKCLKDPTALPNVDLAIIAIPAQFVYDTIEFLIKNKNTKAFIILSAGFSEIGPEGKALENKITELCNKNNASLIGPNCVGVLTPSYKGTFTGPIPKLHPKGIDFVTGSGATAVFILEIAVPFGLNFASLFSVGNSAQIGVEEVLKYWDDTFNPESSSRVKMIYIEKIDKPDMLLKHASSLIKKGCKIIAIKSGTTSAGSRAVSSHTGALAGSDMAVDALFKKAGIIRCYGRQELVYLAGVFTLKQLKGNRIAVITHAGGPGVMLTDTLTQHGMEVPKIEGKAAQKLLAKLFHGSSVSNPIDFIATGTAEQLGIILDYVENKFDNIDGSVVIFGTPGLFDVTPVYDMLHEKMKTCKKPIYPVLPSIIQAQQAMQHFVSLGRQYFTEEVILGEALAKAYHSPKPAGELVLPKIDKKTIRKIIDNNPSGYLKPKDVQKLLDAAGIDRAAEAVAKTEDEACTLAKKLEFPVVMKVIGQLHKSDVGGVILNINSDLEVLNAFDKLMKIEGAEGALIQPMLSGTEIFIGAKTEPGYGHIILCGLGGIFIEVLKDVVPGIAPIGKDEALDMIRRIKAYPIIKGVRGKQGVSENLFAEVIVKLSALLDTAPEIAELDFNPLMGTPDRVTVVDSRIKIEK